MRENKNIISVYLVFSFTFFLLLFLGVWQLNKHKIKSYNKNLLLTKINGKPMELDSLKVNIENTIFDTKKLIGSKLNDNIGLKNIKLITRSKLNMISFC